MKDWFRVVTGNKRLLAFGFLFSFFSSFGQTFFVSLFVPFWVQSFNISNAAFGSLYASVTIIAAFLISFSGKYIDKMPLSKFGFMVFSVLIFSVVFLSQVRGLVSLAIGLLLIRWVGQGLMSHTSSTGVAKYLEADRGKALSISAMGHPAGHLLLPLIMLPLISISGWNHSLIIISVFAVIIMIPALIAVKPSKMSKPFEDVNEKISGNGNTKYLSSINFWIIALNIFSIPFICTAVFLYQYSIGESKGWSPSWVAFSFSFFAIFSGLGLIFSGSLTDRFSGLFLFPLYLVPAIAGVLLIAVSGNKFVFPLFYALVGISSGLGSTIKTAMQTEVYGTSNLGKIRSYFSTVMLVSTALGPPVFGYFLDRNVSFNTIMIFCGLFIIITALASFRLYTDYYFRRLRVYVLIPFRYISK